MVDSYVLYLQSGVELDTGWIAYSVSGGGARADARVEIFGRFAQFLRARGRSIEVSVDTPVRVRVGRLGGHGTWRHDVRTTIDVRRRQIRDRYYANSSNGVWRLTCGGTKVCIYCIQCI